MRILACLCFLFLCAGCSKITGLTSSTATETEQTGDPVYDTQNEMKVLVPWTWVL